MSEMGTPLSIHIEELSGRTGSMEVAVLQLNVQERRKRAAKAAGISWGLAFVTLFFPIVHFVLVPLFLIGGFVIFYILYRRDRIYLERAYSCPKCAAPIVFLSRSEVSWPHEEICPKCRTMLRLMPISQARS